MTLTCANAPFCFESVTWVFVSRVLEKHHAAPHAAQFFGIPLWLSLIILTGGLAVGSLLTVASGTLGLAFVVCFVVTVLFLSILTQPKSLFLLVASIPIFFAVAIVLTGWLLVRQGLPNPDTPLSTTQIITSVYPLLQQFPVIFGATVGAGLLAAIRLFLLRRFSQQLADKTTQEYRKETETNRRSAAQASRARQQTQRTRVRDHATAETETVTVEELLKRNSQQRSEKKRGAAERPISPAATTVQPVVPDPEPATPQQKPAATQRPRRVARVSGERPAAAPQPRPETQNRREPVARQQAPAAAQKPRQGQPQRRRQAAPPAAAQPEPTVSAAHSAAQQRAEQRAEHRQQRLRRGEAATQRRNAQSEGRPSRRVAASHPPVNRQAPAAEQQPRQRNQQSQQRAQRPQSGAESQGGRRRLRSGQQQRQNPGVQPRNVHPDTTATNPGIGLVDGARGQHSLRSQSEANIRIVKQPGQQPRQSNNRTQQPTGTQSSTPRRRRRRSSLNDDLYR